MTSLVVILALSSSAILVAADENISSGKFQEMQTQIRVLQWQVVALSLALIVLLTILVLRQFYKKRRMRILAMTDELTKLPNRRHILTFLGDQAKTAYEEEQPLSVIVFDIVGEKGFQRNCNKSVKKLSQKNSVGQTQNKCKSSFEH